MIEKFIFLTNFYYSEGQIGRMFDLWNQEGFFTYLFPFLLIFSIVFILITRLDAFENNKGVSGVIAVVVALMAVQLEMVPRFFAEIFPRLGIGIIIILVLLILAGAFVDPRTSTFTWIFFTVGVLSFLVILYQSFDIFNGHFWNEYSTSVIGLIIIIVILAVVVGSGGSNDNRKSSDDSPRALIFGKRD